MILNLNCTPPEEDENNIPEEEVHHAAQDHMLIPGAGTIFSLELTGSHAHTCKN